MLSGIALGGDGQAQGSMGVDWGDYLHEGRLSMFVTNFHEQPDTLYRNMGKDGFSDVSWPAKIAHPTFLMVGWGTAFFDMDNDGWLDILVANGHVYPQVDSVPGGITYRQPLQLFRNNRNGTFEDVSKALSAIPAESRRGAAFGDINNDGNIDVVMVNVGTTPTLLLNQGGNHNHRVLFKLVGTEEQQVCDRRAGDGESREAGAVQRSSRRRQLYFAERSPVALWHGGGIQDERSRNRVAERKSRSPA